MATWKPKPDDPVGVNEVIGRRLFDEPKLAGAKEQKPFAGLDLRNFTEKRDREFSVDRLGRTGIDAGVLKYLRPRATNAAKRFHPAKRFDGWATLRVRILAKPPLGEAVWLVSASPITDVSPPEDNIYHAHVALPKGVSPYTSALHLRELFTQYGEVRPERNERARIGTVVLSWVLACMQKIKGLFRRSRSSP
jgi:hypothetical protein